MAVIMFKDAGVVRTDAPKNDKMHFCKRYLAQFRRIEAGVESMKAPLLKRDTEAFRALQRHITIWWTYNQRDGSLPSAEKASKDPVI